MFDDLQSGDAPEAANRASGAERPFADREVPMDAAYPRMSIEMHAWLDGDATETSVRRLERPRDVDFWKRLRENFSNRRSARPRPGFAARVMAGISRLPTDHGVSASGPHESV